MLKIEIKKIEIEDERLPLLKIVSVKNRLQNDHGS